MESSEEMVTPRAAASEPDEEERKAPAAEVPVERAVEADVAGSGEVIVDAFPPETAGHVREGEVDEAEVEVHAVVAQEPEVKDVLVAEESVVQESVADAPAVKEVAKVHPVLEPKLKVDEVVVVEQTPVAPDVKGAGATVVLKTPELIRRNVVVKDPAEVSRSQDAAGVHTTEVTGVCGCSIHLPRFKAEFLLGGFYLLQVARGPAVAVVASGQRATWWNCCGLFDAFTGSGR